MIRELLRHAKRDVQQASQLFERIDRIVHANVHDAIDGDVGPRRYGPDDEQPGRLHAARIAAGRLTGVEGIHQPLRHRSFPVLVGARHVLQHVFAGERIALDREILAGDVAGVAAEVNEILRVEIPVDHVLAGIDGGAPFRVDHRELPGVAARILVGQLLDDLRGTQSLLQQLDRFRAVEAVGCRLRGDGADPRNRVRNGRAGRKRMRLHGDAELGRRRIECDDGEGVEPGIGE